MYLWGRKNTDNVGWHIFLFPNWPLCIRLFFWTKRPLEGVIEETVNRREPGVAYVISRGLKWLFHYSFLDPGSVAERGLDSEPGTTPFNIYCFSLDLRVLRQLKQKQMRKRIVSRAWCSLDLQQCLSHLPAVCHRDLILRFYGSPSLTELPHSSAPVSGNSALLSVVIWPGPEPETNF